MRHNFISKFLAASVLTLGLTVFANLPATATTAPPTDTVPPVDTTAPIDATDDIDADDDGFDWGWLGLLGLIGLAGLARKDDDRVARYREPDEVSSTSNPRY